MEDVKAQVKEVVKQFTKDYVSEVIKESTKKLIKSSYNQKKEELEAALKNRSVEEVERYFAKDANFNNAFESTVKSTKEASLEKIQASFEKHFASYIPCPPIGHVVSWINQPLHVVMIIIAVVSITLIALPQLYDKTPPPAPFPDDGVTGWSNYNTPTFSWYQPSDTSGIAGYYYSVDGGSETWTTSTAVTLSSQSDESHKFYVSAKDNAGNIGAYGSDDFKIVTT